jgi:Bacteriophage clamp loader A subunit
MPDLFKDIVPSILQNKKNAFEDDVEYKDYNAFIVNRALSYHQDCLLYAQEMNMLPNLDKDMQYQYLINTIRSMKRPFHKWQKAESLDDLECVKRYFGYSNQKAKEALRILTNEQLTEIRKRTDKGGVKK